MDKYIFLIISLLFIITIYYESEASSKKILTINEKTTPVGIYEQIGSSGTNLSDDYGDELILMYDNPMTVYYFDSKPFTICKSGCDGKEVIFTFIVDEKNQSFLRNTFRGIFKQKLVLHPLYPMQIID